MKLALVYRGLLHANGSKDEKQQIRRQFHKQLRELWKTAPFSPEPESFYQPVGPFNFVPLIVSSREEIAKVHITMLRPEPPGNIVSQGGDIDNRLKTLFDSLTKPQVGDIPSGDAPGEDENPFFCLLENDNLITEVSVVTDQLFEPCERSFVNLLIQVQIEKIQMIWGHMQILLS